MFGIVIATLFQPYTIRKALYRCEKAVAHGYAFGSDCVVRQTILAKRISPARKRIAAHAAGDLITVRIMNT